MYIMLQESFQILGGGLQGAPLRRLDEAQLLKLLRYLLLSVLQAGSLQFSTS